MRTFLKLSDQRGVAAVEFAIVLPLLVLLFAGIVEFSLLLYNQQVITNASREAARAAINPDYDEEFDTQVIKNIALDYCGQKLITFGGSANLPTVSLLPESFETRSFEDDIIVRVDYVYNYLMPFIIGLGTTKNLRAETVMRMM